MPNPDRGPRVAVDGLKLAELRAKAGLTQTALANLAGIAKNTVWALECTAASSNHATAIKLAAALGCPVADLIGDPPAYRPPRAYRKRVQQ